MKNVMELYIMSGKMTILDNMTLQSPRISTKQLNRDFEIFSTKYFFKYSHYGLKIVLLTSSSFPGVAYFGICSLEPVIYTFIITFCQWNMNTVREKSEKRQEILKKPVAMNPALWSLFK